MDAQESQLRFKQADQLFKAGEYAPALKILDELDRAYPGTKNIMYPRALCLEKLNRGPEALRVAEDIIARHDAPKAHELRKRLIQQAETVFQPAAPGDAFAPDAQASPGAPESGMDFDGGFEPSPRPMPPPIPQRASGQDLPKGFLITAGVFLVIMLVGIAIAATTSNPETSTAGVGLVFITAGLGIYLFFCYCLKLIVEKAGEDPGILIYIPLIQMIPMFRAAGMSLLWILALFVPILSFIATILLWFKLCEARGKPGWLGLLVIVPIANILLILYLAFAD